jgi:ATP-dependent Clp protease ATP-binding subunit ClpA
VLEHFSARAIEAFRIAQEEARRLEFSQVNGAHLILGLAGEAGGVAARALRSVGFDLRRGRAAAERLWGRGYERSEEIVPADEAKRVFEEAMSIAEKTEPLLVDTQDLLRAVLAQPAGRGLELLKEAGVAPDELMLRLMSERSDELAGHASPAGEPAPPKRFNARLLAPAARRALDLALEMTCRFGHNLVGTEQLLIGLLAAEDGGASAILRSNGLSRVDVEASALRVLGRGTGTTGSPGNSRQVDEALERAWAAARRLGHDQVGTVHMLLGILDLDTGGALHLMDLLKINLSGIQMDAEQAFIDHPRELEPIL